MNSSISLAMNITYIDFKMQAFFVDKKIKKLHFK